MQEAKIIEGDLGKISQWLQSLKKQFLQLSIIQIFSLRMFPRRNWRKRFEWIDDELKYFSAKSYFAFTSDSANNNFGPAALLLSCTAVFHSHYTMERNFLLRVLSSIVTFRWLCFQMRLLCSELGGIADELWSPVVTLLLAWRLLMKHSVEWNGEL